MNTENISESTRAVPVLETHEDMEARLRAAHARPWARHSCPIASHESCVRRIVRDELAADRERTRFVVGACLLLGVLVAIATRSES